MIVAAGVGTLIAVVSYVPVTISISLLAIAGCPVWAWIPLSVLLLTTVPAYIAVWSFWRMTPGNHGGPIWRMIRRRRRAQGLCMNCAYNLTGNVSGVCPECGEPITEKVAVPFW
ncbi:MAG TPA: hypothetical protein PKK06_17615 [Phycisphaerae bacterium]|nr:hypothetical protein [Phycisphaerae bacterium]